MIAGARPSRGYTLIEVLAIGAVIGLLSALMLPALTGFMARQRLNDETAAIVDTIETINRSAVKSSRSYQVTIASDSITAISDSMTISLPLKYSTIQPFNGYSSTFTVNFKGVFIGSFPDNAFYTVQSSGVVSKRCIAVGMLGLVRSGYVENGNSCKPYL